MRAWIAAMKISVDGDGRAEGRGLGAGMADDYGLMPRIDACLLGGGMYPGYEGYWTGIRNEPTRPAWTSNPPTKDEVEWARFTERTPHYVLSKTLQSAGWPNTKFLRGVDEVSALKRQSGKDIYLVGGARTAASLVDAGLVDELRLPSSPVAGEGTAFATRSAVAVPSSGGGAASDGPHPSTGSVRASPGAAEPVIGMRRC